jgi:SAM-dependent methyltransferase
VLEDYRFPASLLGDRRMERAPASDRVAAIRRALRGESSDGSIAIEYCVPWHGLARTGELDLVFSQACLEHIDDLEGAYDSMARWLKPGGYISHQIDFQSHGSHRSGTGTGSTPTGPGGSCADGDPT